jgi:hypothetical protein
MFKLNMYLLLHIDNCLNICIIKDVWDYQEMSVYVFVSLFVHVYCDYNIKCVMEKMANIQDLSSMSQ